MRITFPGISLADITARREIALTNLHPNLGEVMFFKLEG